MEGNPGEAPQPPLAVPPTDPTEDLTHEQQELLVRFPDDDPRQLLGYGILRPWDQQEYTVRSGNPFWVLRRLNARDIETIRQDIIPEPHNTRERHTNALAYWDIAYRQTYFYVDDTITFRRFFVRDFRNYPPILTHRQFPGGDPPGRLKEVTWHVGKTSRQIYSTAEQLVSWFPTQTKPAIPPGLLHHFVCTLRNSLIECGQWDIDSAGTTLTLPQVIAVEDVRPSLRIPSRTTFVQAVVCKEYWLLCSQYSGVPHIDKFCSHVLDRFTDYSREQGIPHPTRSGTWIPQSPNDTNPIPIIHSVPDIEH